jgi:hypothetical protein
MPSLIGFATHDETDMSYLPRMAAAFLPVLFAWFVLAPWFGLFDEQVNLKSQTSLRDWRLYSCSPHRWHHPRAVCRIGNSLHSNFRASLGSYECTRNARLALASIFSLQSVFKIIHFK